MTSQLTILEELLNLKKNRKDIIQQTQTKIHENNQLHLKRVKIL